LHVAIQVYILAYMTSTNTAANITTTRDNDLRYDRITATVDMLGEEVPVAWMTRFDGEKKWTITYKGETVGTTNKRDGIDWITAAADRMNF
jgi:hypothetical protein